MAEVIAKRLVAPGIYIQSAGVRAGERDPFVDAVLEEQGFRSANTNRAPSMRLRMIFSI